jgi:hypothetical protein
MIHRASAVPKGCGGILQLARLPKKPMMSWVNSSACDTVNNEYVLEINSYIILTANL